MTENRMTGTVETYIDENGNLIICNPQPGIDWERLKSLPHDEALAELLEYQTSNGYEWIQPYEIAALTDAPILAWDAVRDDKGDLIDPGAVYWFSNYQLQDAISILKRGGVVTFYKADQ